VAAFAAIDAIDFLEVLLDDLARLRVGGLFLDLGLADVFLQLVERVGDFLVPGAFGQLGRVLLLLGVDLLLLAADDVLLGELLVELVVLAFALLDFVGRPVVLGERVEVVRLVENRLGERVFLLGVVELELGFFFFALGLGNFRSALLAPLLDTRLLGRQLLILGIGLELLFDIGQRIRGQLALDLEEFVLVRLPLATGLGFVVNRPQRHGAERARQQKEQPVVRYLFVDLGHSRVLL